MQTKIHSNPNVTGHHLAAAQPISRLVRNAPKFRLKRLVLFSDSRLFIREYKLPLAMTAIFILVLGSVAFIRMSERASLVGLLAGISSGGKDYATLLSGDKPDEFKKNNTVNTSSNSGNSGAAEQPSGTPSSFTTNPSQPPPSTGGGEGGTGNNPPPAAFGAAIAYFQQNNITLECVNPSKPNKGSCSKKYGFSAGARTSNGPGSVSYSWRSNLPAANSDGSFSVGSGTIVTNLNKDITLSCKNSGSYNLQFVISSPSSVQSEVISFSHNCNDI